MVVSQSVTVLIVYCDSQGWWVKPPDSFTQFYPGYLGKTG